MLQGALLIAMGAALVWWGWPHTGYALLGLVAGALLLSGAASLVVALVMRRSTRSLRRAVSEEDAPVNAQSD